MGILPLYLGFTDNPDDRQKFERVYHAYRRLMYRAAYQILKHHQNTEDALQTAFIKIAQNLHKIDESDCPKTRSFVVIITEGAAINLYNKLKKQNTLSMDALPYDFLPGGNAEDMVMDNALTRELVQSISQLPVLYAEALTLRYLHDLSVKEIARITGTTRAAVQKRMERGLKMLNAAVRGHEDND